MVQPIDKYKSLKEAARIAKEALGVHIDTRYALYEVTPAYTETGYYGRDVPEKRVRVTGGTRDEIQEFMREFQPDKGKHFEARLEELYEKTTVTRKWCMGRKVDLTRLSE